MLDYTFPDARILLDQKRLFVCRGGSRIILKGDRQAPKAREISGESGTYSPETF